MSGSLNSSEGPAFPRGKAVFILGGAATAVAAESAHPCSRYRRNHAIHALRIRRFSVSAMYRLPAASSATSFVRLSSADVAGPPSPP